MKPFDLEKVRSAKPTSAHFTIVKLLEKGFLKHWIQQNHDALAQKAGCPAQLLNEIHGSWFDQANPVVEMGKLLKHENFENMLLWRDKTDLVISVGSSMVGMHSDTVVKHAIYRNKMFDKDHRSKRGRNQCQGTVILNF